MSVQRLPARAPALRSATPSGGASRGGRGCASILTTFGFLSGFWLTSGAAAAQPIGLSSGLDVSFHDVIEEPLGSGATYRFRFVAPEIADGVAFSDVVDDMETLCNEFALARVPVDGARPGKVIVTLMSEPTEFGFAAPDVVQFFESYSIENGVCIWEAF